MRKLFDTGRLFLRGGSAPAHVAAAVLLGLLAGATLGANATLATVLLAAMVFNVSTRALLAAGTAAAAIRLTAESQLAEVGRWLLERTPLGDWLGAGGESLTLALFDFDRYALAGGVAVALAVGIPLAWLAAAVVRFVDARIAVQAASTKKKTPPPSRALLALHGFLAGRATPAPAAVRVGRPLGLTVAAATLVPLAGLLWHFGPDLFERALLDRLSHLNRAEVTAGDVRLSLADGLLEIDDLRIAHPEQLDQDRWRAGYVTALVRLGPLVRGRLEIDKLLVEDASCNVARDRRARRCDLDFAEPSADPQPATNRTIASTPGTEVQGYVRDWERIEISLGRFDELLSTLEQAASAENSAEAIAGRTHCALGRPRPAVWIHEARVQGLPAEWSLGQDATLELTELATDAHAGGRTPQVAFSAPALGMSLSVDLYGDAGVSRRYVKFTATNRDLVSLLVGEKLAGAATLYAGAAHVSAQGWLDGEEWKLPVRIDLRELDVEFSEERSLACITADVWNDGLYEMAALEVQALLVGDWRTARLTLDERQLVSDYRRQLLARGDLEMVACIDRQQAAEAHSTEAHSTQAVADATPIERTDLTEAANPPATVADSTADTTEISSAVAADESEPESPVADAAADLVADESTGAADLLPESQTAPEAERVAEASAPGRQYSARPSASPLRYPRNVAGMPERRVASSTAPRAPRPADIARVAHTAPLPEEARSAETSSPASARSAPPASEGVDELVASVEEREAPQATRPAAAARPRLPAPIGLELGYDEQSELGASVVSAPNRGPVGHLREQSQFVERGARPRPQPTMGQLPESQTSPDAGLDLEFPAVEPAEEPSRLRRWSGEVAGGMRRLLPRFGADDESAAADSDGLAGTPHVDATAQRGANPPAERVVPRDPAMARRMAQRDAAPRREQRRTAPAESTGNATAPTDDKPWYQFWR